MKREKIALIFILFLVLTILCTPFLFSRAGGAGGSSGGSSDSGGGLEIVFYLIFDLLLNPFIPIWVKLVVIAIIIIIGVIAYRMKKAQTVLNKLPAGTHSGKIKGYESFLKNNPGFNEEQFKTKVKTAFIQIQEAWQAQDIGNVRKFLSDGVYQRFNTQFKMMKLLKQKNTISNLNIKNIYIDRIESDGLFDIVHVAIHASIVDHFVCEIDNSLSSGGAEEFVEYWSFLKKRGAEEKNLYTSGNCPNCGAGLPEKLGELSKCEYCKTMLNTGEFDWVLSEITQADDYIGTHSKFLKSTDLTEKVRRILHADQDFCIQLLEDKASNGYLQILTAYTIGNPSIMRRFVTDSAFKKLKETSSDGILYNRIYLNDVSLIGIRETENSNILAIAVKSSFQRVRLNGKKIGKIDQAVVSRTEVVFMSRDKASGKSKGSLYAHQCPGCGAPVEDSLDLKCRYCGNLLNSTKSEWIVSDIMPLAEYRNHLSSNKTSYSFNINPDFLDKMFDVRDYALNNVMVMIAADGIFDSREQVFAETLAKKWGFNINKLKPMFTMAKSGRLVIRMPEDNKHKLRIYKLMEKAAAADGNISESEQELLNSIRSTISS